MSEKALKVIDTLKQNGFQAVYAGGYVRDMLLGIKAHDIDIATDARPEQVEELFDRTLPVGKAFGVIWVLIDSEEFEVATFRSDVGSDGRRPDTVSFVSLEEDAKRRDLTINALFYDPIEKKIYDFVEGRKDLEKGIIKLIGDPDKRIEEDKLRMLRVVRFASRFGFHVDDRTKEAVRSHAKDITRVSAERIGEELTKILRTGRYETALHLLFDMNLIKYILPEVWALDGVEQPKDYHPEGGCLQHTIIALETLSEEASDELRWGVLFHDIGKPTTFEIKDRIRFNGHDFEGQALARKALTRLRFPNDFIEHVSSLVRNHMKFMHVQKMRSSRLKRFMRLDRFDEHMELHRVDCISSHGDIKNYLFVQKKLEEIPEERIRPPRILTGRDLIKLGFKPGPLFREVLTAVEDEQLEGRIETPDEALNYVREHFS